MSNSNDEKIHSDCSGCAQLRAEGFDSVDFVVIPRAGGGWHAWAEALVRLFSRRGHEPTQAFVIHQEHATDRYVQVMIGHGLAFAEASSNKYLTGASRLTPTHHQALTELGWTAPDTDDSGEAVANWTMPRVEGDWEALAAVLLATVSGVFGFDENDTVCMNTFTTVAPCRDCFPRVAA